MARYVVFIALNMVVFVEVNVLINTLNKVLCSYMIISQTWWSSVGSILQ